jgi:hypothetical protein
MRSLFNNTCYKICAGCIQTMEAKSMNSRPIIRAKNRPSRPGILRATLGALVILLVALSVPMLAQNTGPMAPPESTKFPTPPAPAKPEPPAIPPEEIIRRVAANEDRMVQAIMGYTFQKSVQVQEIGADNKPTGQLEVVTQETIAPDGKLYEKPLRRPPSTLHSMEIERGDTDLAVQTPFFPLTTAQLPKYQIIFGGKQPLDELSAYYFTIKPRALERAHAYFSGVVWVDEQDLVIVKSIGKWVTETGDITASGLPFAVFETYRQQVGKNLWFPAYSRSDETYEAGDNHVPIRMIVRWSEFTPVTGAPATALPATNAPATARPSDNKGTP